MTIKALRNRVDDKGINDKILGKEGKGRKGIKDLFVENHHRSGGKCTPKQLSSQAFPNEGIASRMSDGSLLEGLTTLGVESERKRVGACHLISFFSRCDAG